MMAVSLLHISMPLKVLLCLCWFLCISRHQKLNETAGALVNLLASYGPKPGRSPGTRDCSHVQDRPSKVRGDSSFLDSEVRHGVECHCQWHLKQKISHCNVSSRVWFKYEACMLVSVTFNAIYIMTVLLDQSIFNKSYTHARAHREQRSSETAGLCERDEKGVEDLSDHLLGG